MNQDDLSSLSSSQLYALYSKKLSQEREFEKNKFKNRIKSDLELEFEKSLTEFNVKFDQQLKTIISEIEKLKLLSDQYGIPIEVGVYQLFGEDCYDRVVRYRPASTMKLWSNLGLDILHDHDIYPGNSDGMWITSSIGC